VTTAASMVPFVKKQAINWQWQALQIEKKKGRISHLYNYHLAAIAMAAASQTGQLELALAIMTNVFCCKRSYNNC